MVLNLFILFNVMSYLYVVFTNKYNGDFLDLPSRLSRQELVFNLFLSILPFFFLYCIYDHYTRVKKVTRITIPTQPFGVFLFVNVIFQIVVTVLYGVGRLGQDIYDAPTFIKYAIQIFNRFDSVVGVALFSVVVGKKNKFQYFLWSLVIILAILRASASIFFVVILVFVILNYSSVVVVIKKRMLIIVFLIFVAPILIAGVYSVRDQLRQNKSKIELKIERDKIDNVKLVLGKLVGRLSSYTNSAIIMERKNKMLDLTRNFTVAQYPKEAFVAVYGKILNYDDIAYKNLLIESSGSHTRTYTSMNGTQGVLLISYYQSMSIFVVNLLTILVIVLLSFELLSLFHHEKIFDVFFLFFSLTVMSGGAVEFMDRLMVIFLYSSMFIFFNMLKIPKFKLSR